MTDINNKRRFKSNLYTTNQAFLHKKTIENKMIHVAFVLPDHFSMMSYTAVIDALITANLVKSTTIFSYQTFSAKETSDVISDIAISVSTNKTLADLNFQGTDSLDVLVLCGGFRCELSENIALTKKLKQASLQKIIIGGLWNGAIPIAHAQLLNNQTCALHPDNHSFAKEKFPTVSVSEQPIEESHNIFTCSGPASALNLALSIIEKFQDTDTVSAIQEILLCDIGTRDETVNTHLAKQNLSLPNKLQQCVLHMNSNIEDPLSIEELGRYTSTSRRQIERLFKTHLKVSPSRYYLELRITYARRLLFQTQESITNISVACGFTTASHFSNCFKDFFGISPSSIRRSLDKHD